MNKKYVDIKSIKKDVNLLLKCLSEGKVLIEEAEKFMMFMGHKASAKEYREWLNKYYE